MSRSGLVENDSFSPLLRGGNPRAREKKTVGISGVQVSGKPRFFCEVGNMGSHYSPQLRGTALPHF